MAGIVAVGIDDLRLECVSHYCGCILAGKSGIVYLALDIYLGCIVSDDGKAVGGEISDADVRSVATGNLQFACQQTVGMEFANAVCLDRGEGGSAYLYLYVSIVEVVVFIALNRQGAAFDFDREVLLHIVLGAFDAD
jgi:hypothetical protein